MILTKSSKQRTSKSDKTFYKVVIARQIRPGLYTYYTPFYCYNVDFGRLYEQKNGRGWLRKSVPVEDVQPDSEIHHIRHEVKRVVGDGAFHLFRTLEDADRFIKDAEKGFEDRKLIVLRAVVPAGTPYIYGRTPNQSTLPYLAPYPEDDYQSVAVTKVAYFPLNAKI